MSDTCLTLTDQEKIKKLDEELIAHRKLLKELIDKMDAFATKLADKDMKEMMECVKNGYRNLWGRV